jgi:hypothetical protein
MVPPCSVGPSLLRSKRHRKRRLSGRVRAAGDGRRADRSSACSRWSNRGDRRPWLAVAARLDDWRSASRITRGAATDSRPAWAPDGSRLAFVRDDGRDTSIVQHDLKSGTEKVLRPMTAVTWRIRNRASGCGLGRRQHHSKMRRETHGTNAARKYLHGDKCMFRLVASFVIGLRFATSLHAQEASLIG